MAGKFMVAYNPVSKLYLRKKKKTWYTTPDAHLASACPEGQLRQALTCVGESLDGGWMLMKQADAAKIANVQKSMKTMPVVVKPSVPRKKSVVARKTPQSSGSMALIEAIKTVELLVSQEKVDELSRRQSDADKEITDIYHYIETTNLNACQGYKAYKKLQAALVERRKIKNEVAVVGQIRQMGLVNGDYLTAIAQRSYEPQVDILAEVDANE